MSNVRFLRGSQANLDKLTSFVEGAFYLTSDTDRLYFAHSASNLAYLNKYIYTGDSRDKLPKDLSKVNVGDFYYINTENILCTKA